MVEATCYCKKINITSYTEPRYVFNCHCTICRGRSGAPLTTWVLLKEDDVKIEGQLKYFDTNPNVKRGFCFICGTDMSWQNKKQGKWIGIVSGVCKQAENYRPTKDIWIQSKLNWVPLDPSTEKHLKGPFEPQVYPAIEPGLINEPINLDGIRFNAVSNSGTGQVSADTVFYYHQNQDRIWATYEGGQIKTGFLLGTINEHNVLNFSYTHLDHNNELKTGYCTSYPSRNEHGKLRLEEHWQWTCDTYRTGFSVIQEI